MPYPKEFPYDLLEVSPNASLREIMAAYPKALAKNRERAGEVQHAFNELRNPEKRLEYDALLYHAIGGEAEAEQFAQEYGEQTYIPSTLAPLPVKPALTDLRNDDYQEDFTEITYRRVKISTTARYDNPAWGLLPVIFDR
ncbi:MAG TPA: hypothetical protein EYP49_09060 [Anaerolineae bacterium]|nr:hypothetical protein [Anaerolineae bacterium]